MKNLSAVRAKAHGHWVFGFVKRKRHPVL